MNPIPYHLELFLGGVRYGKALQYFKQVIGLRKCDAKGVPKE